MTDLRSQLLNIISTNTLNSSQLTHSPDAAGRTEYRRAKKIVDKELGALLA